MFDSKFFNVQETPSRRIHREVLGTPVFSITNSSTFKTDGATIGAGRKWEYTLEERTNQPFSKYCPFNAVEIYNGGTSNIKFYWNGWDDLGFLVFSSSAREINREGFRQFRITNEGTNDITPDQIQLTVWSTGMTSDEKAKRDFVGNYNLIDILKNGWMLVR